MQVDLDESVFRTETVNSNNGRRMPWLYRIGGILVLEGVRRLRKAARATVRLHVYIPQHLWNPSVAARNGNV